MKHTRKELPSKEVLIQEGYNCSENGEIYRFNIKVGFKNPDGYLYVKILGSNFLIHRVIWLWFKGPNIPHEIDHIDRNKENNSLANLRESTRTLNVFNTDTRVDNKSGYKGVCFHKKTNKWNAQINIGPNKRKSLGFYDTPELAHQAYLLAYSNLHLI